MDTLSAQVELGTLRFDVVVGSNLSGDISSYCTDAIRIGRPATSSSRSANPV